MSKPNFLFISTDYQRGVDLPSFGSPFLIMPNVDRLCEEGVVFKNHISTNPICMPARACWMTGQYPHTHGLWDNVDMDWLHTTPTLMRKLKDLDYYNVNVGKLHIGPVILHDRLEDFHRRIECYSRDGGPSDDDYGKFLEENGWARALIKSFRGLHNIKPGNAVYDWPLEESLYPDNYIADQAIELIESGEFDDKDQWFFHLSFCGPHNPWTAPPRLSSYYLSLEELPIGVSKENELMGKPIDYTRHRYCYGETMWEVYDYLSKEEKIDLQRRVRAQHYANLTLIDERIGDVLRCLENKNLLDDTYIIFSSDHGASLFDNGLLHKGTHFDESVRVPFIIHHSKKIKPNIIDQFSTHVDLYPTLVSLAGGTIPNNIEGYDLSDLLSGEHTGSQDFAIMECTLATSIITHQWKMSTHHIYGDSDLYDLTNDPHCFNNLFEKQGFEQKIENLQKKIVAWRKKLSPDMDIPDNLTEWRECLGPKEYIESFRNRYIKEYERLAKLNPEERPGKVGHYARELLDRINN